MSEQNLTPPAQQDDEGLKELRRAAARAKELERENADLKRDRAFRQAGLDPDDKRVGYFVKGYEGDLTAEAIRKEAEEAGFLAAPGPSLEQQEALTAQGRIEGFVSSSQPVGSASGEAALEAAFQKGGNPALLAEMARQGIPLTSGD
jgi:ribosomal protein L12E/L44/L45/RPP1/RPP2